MRKKPWFFKNGTGLGILGVMLVFGMMADGCPTGNDDQPPDKTYTVTFDTDGGGSIPNQTVEEDGLVTRPPNPTKGNLPFANWYRDKATTGLWNFDRDKVGEDITLYAKWAKEGAKPVKVTFNANGGSPTPKAQDVVEGEPMEEPPDPSMEGYAFNGWYDADNKR
ncbi:MAG: InlB B-repeat-containing protein [Spirochaetaceae bacterium]|nr:InlB B-repeat-containing protein [Spirochaetaceae bacterium]